MAGMSATPPGRECQKSPDTRYSTTSYLDEDEIAAVSMVQVARERVEDSKRRLVHVGSSEAT